MMKYKPSGITEWSTSEFKTPAEMIIKRAKFCKVTAYRSGNSVEYSVTVGNGNTDIIYRWIDSDPLVESMLLAQLEVKP